MNTVIARKLRDDVRKTQLKKLRQRICIMKRKRNHLLFNLEEAQRDLVVEKQRRAKHQIDCASCKGYGTIVEVLIPCGHTICDLCLTVLSHSHFGDCPICQRTVMSHMRLLF
jgi:hypothetical protein